MPDPCPTAVPSSNCRLQAGHALAATAEGVQVSAAGFSLVLMLPAAFVQLDSSDLAALGRHSMLRVATAGAWHNAALGLACWPAAQLLARLWWGPLRPLLAQLHLLLSYTLSLSAALALLNMAPVHFLDGQQALEALLLRPLKPQELPEQAEAQHGGSDSSVDGDSMAPASNSSKARAVRWILHAGTGLYAAVLMLHVLRMQ